jgi:hypothetical protein
MTRQEELFVKIQAHNAQITALRAEQERELKAIAHALMPTISTINWDVETEYNDEGGTDNYLRNIVIGLEDGTEIQLGSLDYIEDGFEADDDFDFEYEEGKGPADYFYFKGLVKTAPDDLDYLAAVIHALLSPYEVTGDDSGMDL